VGGGHKSQKHNGEKRDERYVATTNGEGVHEADALQVTGSGVKGEHRRRSNQEAGDCGPKKNWRRDKRRADPVLCSMESIAHREGNPA